MAEFWLSYRFNNAYQGPDFTRITGPYPSKETAEASPPVTILDTEKNIAYRIVLATLDDSFAFGRWLLSIRRKTEGSVLVDEGLD